MKKNTSIPEITSALPDEFGVFLTTVRKLQFNEKPNYIMLRELFKKCFNDQKFLNDGLYDWTQIPNIRLPIPFPKQNTSHILKSRRRTPPDSVEILETRENAADNNKTLISITPSRKRKANQDSEVNKKVTSLTKTKTAQMILRPRKNRRSTTTTFATQEYDASHEVIEISDDDS